MGTGPVNGIALAGTVAVHAALVLAPVASSRVHEPPAPVMSVVRVRIVAPPPEASPAPRRAGPPVNVAASAKPEPEVVRAAERRDPPLESTSLAAPGDSAMPATSATEAVTAPAFVKL